MMLGTLALAIPIALAIATDLALRPWIANGVATPDLPLLVLLWASLSDQRLRIHSVVMGLALLRAVFGLDNPWLGYAPLAVACELVLLCRRRMNLRDRFVRTVLLPFPIWSMMVVDTFLRHRSLSPLSWQQLWWSAALGALLGFGLFSILDAMAPVLLTRDSQRRRQIVG